MCQLLPDTILLHTVACKLVSVCWHRSPFFSVTLLKQPYAVCLHVSLWVEETTSPGRSFSCHTVSPRQSEGPGAPARWGSPRGFPEIRQAVREGHAPGLLPGSLPSFLSAWRLLAFISGCLWFPHGSNILAWELGAASVQRHAKPIPWCACFHPYGFGWCQNIPHVACPVTSGNSRVWQPTISSQTGELTAAPNLWHRTLHVPWNRLLPTHTTKADLHYKPNLPAYNIAATLHCLVLSKMQKGTGGSVRQEGAVPQPAWSPLQPLPSHGSAQQDLKQPLQLTGHSWDFFFLKLSFFSYAAVGSWTHIVRAVSVGFRKWNWMCHW